jgi:predicted short-subunit dehydrogenase-like oxidoreductase (DUF2520 family)
LAAAGGQVVAVTGLHPEHAEELATHIPGCRAFATPDEVAANSALVVLAVPDDALAALGSGIRWSPGQRVLHLSGASGTRVLASAAEQGAIVAALHPLMTFTRALAESPIAEISARLRGCVWALQTDDASFRETLRGLVAALGGQTVLLTEADRAPYHLAAVLVSNYVVTLMGAATGLWQTFGVDAQVAREALLPLLRAAVENLGTMDPAAALTGPIARGDLGTIRAHLDWLASAANTTNVGHDALRSAYLALARLALPLAEAKGTLSPATIAELRALLTDASENRSDQTGDGE